MVSPSARKLLCLESATLPEIKAEFTERPYLDGIFREILGHTEAVAIEKSVYCHQQERTLKWSSAPVVDALGKSIGKIVLLSDITKEKEVDRMKSEFISTTSHELRTPLAAIKESVALVLDGTAGTTNANQERFLEVAKRNIDRLTNLINNLLDLSKIDTGKMHLDKKHHHFAALVENARSLMDLLARKSSIVLHVELPNDLPEIVCDGDRIVQALINLIGNAIKFTPQQGSITVKARMDQEQTETETRSVLRVGIKDTGPGISAEDAEHLFKRFIQLDGSLTRQHVGTGLGLAISKELVELHGGRIWVESELVKGSEFCFILPVG